MISLSVVVWAIIYLIIAGLIFWLLWWALDRLGPPQPFRKIAEVILILGAVFVCIAVLLGLADHPIVRW